MRDRSSGRELRLSGSFPAAAMRCHGQARGASPRRVWAGLRHIGDRSSAHGEPPLGERPPRHRGIDSDGRCSAGEASVAGAFLANPALREPSASFLLCLGRLRLSAARRREIILGKALAGPPRDQSGLCTKVGKCMKVRKGRLSSSTRGPGLGLPCANPRRPDTGRLDTIHGAVPAAGE